MTAKFFAMKCRLAVYALKLICAGRIDAALRVLRDRRLGYEAMNWSQRIPIQCLTIIDAGAHTGATSAAMMVALRPSRLLSVEANPSLVEGLRKRFLKYAEVQIIAFALAERAGVSPFFIQNFDAASSLFPLKNGYLSLQGLPEGSRRIEVQTKTLADVAREAGLTDIDLLKLDCQGAELRILLGAGNLLRHIRYIYTEVTFESIYEQGALFHEIHTFLRDNGFRLEHLNTHQTFNGNIDQGDALYVRMDKP
jgi:FkbM family methyltransferase